MNAAKRQTWIDEARQHTEKVRGDIEVTIAERSDGVDVFGKRESGDGHTHTAAGHVSLGARSPVEHQPSDMGSRGDVAQHALGPRSS